MTVQATLDAIVGKIETLAPTASPEQAAYLAKAFESVYGKGSVQELIDEGSNQQGLLSTEAQNIIAQFNNDFSLGDNWPAGKSIKEVIEESVPVKPKVPFRWNLFQHHTDASWMMGNNAEPYGGVAPSNWGDGNHRAVHLPWSNPSAMRTLFNRVGRCGPNALMFANQHRYHSSTNGETGVVMFRVKNNTASPIAWQWHFYWSSFTSWGEHAGIAINGSEVWAGGGNNWWANSSPVLSIPANRTNTVIITVTAGPQGSHELRTTILGFNGSCLNLPAGLEYVDDLDSDNYPN